MRLLAWLAIVVAAADPAAAAPDELARFRAEGDAIRTPLASLQGDAARGRDVVFGRDGNCLLCHAVPDSGGRPMGNLAPSLAGVGSRLNAGQLRLRIVDSMQLNRNTIMPSYYRSAGLNRVAEPWRSKPILTAQQIEDVVAYLLTLR